MSAIQAAISSSAGLIVCQHSCRVSFLRASHFMSDAYAWFGAAYFMYDIWWMFKVYGQKLRDEGHTNDANGRKKLEKTLCDQQIIEQNGNYLEKPIKISFLKFCQSHPVMLVHHTFLASFGLVVIVVSCGVEALIYRNFVFSAEILTPQNSFQFVWIRLENLKFFTLFKNMSVTAGGFRCTRFDLI